jgi:hypothetical protein
MTRARRIVAVLAVMAALLTISSAPAFAQEVFFEPDFSTGGDVLFRPSPTWSDDVTYPYEGPNWWDGQVDPPHFNDGCLEDGSCFKKNGRVYYIV